MAKITRLDDPNNPYNVKRTPTAAPTGAQKARNKAANDRVPPASRPAAPPNTPSGGRSVHPMMKRANEQYNEARSTAIDNAVEGKKRADVLRRSR